MVDEPELARVKVTIVADGPALDASLEQAKAKIGAFDADVAASARRAQTDMMAGLLQYSNAGEKASAQTQMLARAADDLSRVERSLAAAYKAGNITLEAKRALSKQSYNDYQSITAAIVKNKAAVEALARSEVEGQKAMAAARAAAAQAFFNANTGIGGASAVAGGASYTALRQDASFDASRAAAAQSGINSLYGIGGPSATSQGATISALRDQAAAEAAATAAARSESSELNAMMARAARLEASIHPLNAALMELNATTAEATALQEAGIISMEVRDGIISAATTKYENLSLAMNENLVVSKAWEEQARAANAQAAINDVLVRRGVLPGAQSATANGATFSALDEAVRAGTLKTLENDANGAASAVGRVGGASSLTTREIIVLGREAARGDLSRMAGSATLLTQSLFGTSGAVLAVIGGVIAAGVTIGGFTYLVHKGGQELLDFNNSLVATGNAAGITAGQFYTMGTTIHAATGASTDSIRELEMELTRTGKVSSDSMGLMITDAEELAKAMGEKPAAALKQLETLTGNVSKASAELNAQFNFLTESEWLEIRAMDEAGNKAGAMKEALKDLNSHLKDVKENTGTLETAFRNLKNEIDSVVQSIESIGRESTAAEKIADIQNKMRIEKLEGRTNQIHIDGVGDLTDVDAQKMVAYYQSLIQWENRDADAKAKVTEATRQSIADDETYGKKSIELQAVFQAQARTTKELADARAQYAKAITPEAMAAAQLLIDTKTDVLQGEKVRIAQLQKQIAGPQPRAGRTGHDEGETDLAQINKATTALELEDKAQAGLNRSVADGTMSAKEAAAQSQVNAKWAAEVARQTQLRVDIEALGAKNDPKSIALRASLTKSYDALTGKIKAYRAELEVAAGIKADTQIIAQTQAQDDQNASLELEIQLIGAGNRERAIAIAQAKAMKELNNLGVDPASRYGKDYISSKVKGANLGADQQNAEYTQSSRDALKQQGQQLAIVTDTFGMTAAAADVYTKQMQLLNDATNKHLDLSAAEIDELKKIAKQYADQANLLTVLQRGHAQMDKFPITSTIDQDARALATAKSQMEQYFTDVDSMEARGVITHEQAEKEKADATKKFADVQLSASSDFFTALASLSSSGNKTLKAIGKDAAIVQATISAYEAINKALALPFPLNLVEAAAIGIETFANVQAIEAMATGGIVHGIGGPTDDMNLRALSNGEGVLTAAGVQNNPGLVEAVNRGAKISVGGGLGSPSVAANWNSSGGGGGSSAWLRGITIVNNGTPQTYKVDSIDESGVRLIAEDVVRNRAGSQVAADLANPNSKVSQSMTRHVNAPRRTR